MVRLLEGLYGEQGGERAEIERTEEEPYAEPKANTDQRRRPRAPRNGGRESQRTRRPSQLPARQRRAADREERTSQSRLPIAVKEHPTKNYSLPSPL